jgi:hypothetical protein
MRSFWLHEEVPVHFSGLTVIVTSVGDFGELYEIFEVIVSLEVAWNTNTLFLVARKSTSTLFRLDRDGYLCWGFW